MILNDNDTSAKEKNNQVLQHGEPDKGAMNKGLWQLNCGIAFMLASSAASGYNMSLINGLLSLPEFTKNMAGANDSVIGLISGGIALGGICSFIPASYMADKFGRKPNVGIGCIVMIVAAIVQTVRPYPWVLFGTRVMLGVGGGLMQSAAPSLVTEIAHPDHRGALTAMYQTAWYWGAIVSAAVTLGMLNVSNSWSLRLPCLMQIVLPTIQLFGLCLVPESPRWHIAVGRSEKARATLIKYHANGDERNEAVNAEFQEISNAIHGEMSEMLEMSQSAWRSFFKTKGNIRKLTICILIGIMTEWAGNGIISYYLAPILNSIGISSPQHQTAINLSLQVWNTLWAAAGALTCDRFGRRRLWLVSTSSMFLCLALAACLSALFEERHFHLAGIGVVPMLFLFFAAYDVAYTPLFIAYPVEIMPLSLRSKGLAVTLFTNAAAAFFNQYVNPIAFGRIGWKLYLVNLACLVVWYAMIYLLFPETAGRMLEDIAAVFDGEDSINAESSVESKSVRNDKMD